VIIANDRPAKKRSERLSYRDDLSNERGLPSGNDYRIVEADEIPEEQSQS
jgi:hypothetical protein